MMDHLEGFHPVYLKKHNMLKTNIGKTVNSGNNHHSIQYIDYILFLLILSFF